MRRTGASWDVAVGRRSLNEVQKSGRWRSRRSVARYEKAGQVSKGFPQAAARRATEDAVMRSKFGAGVQQGRERPLVMLDLFAGVARVSQALSELGHVAEIFDFKNGPALDISDKHVLNHLLHTIRRSSFDGVMVAPSCATFNIARHPALRLAA
eukprot:4962138-Pyramimonas_sp.AAC.1